MPRISNRDEFSRSTRDTVAKRASYICSNPDCRALTLAPSTSDDRKVVYIGKAAHIIAASPGGARYDSSLTPEQRKDIKESHEEWVRSNLNKSPATSIITTVDGEHHASGKGEVTALDIRSPAFIKPGTKSSAEGEGRVTATRIGDGKEKGE
jgi:hypothetical protein